MELRPATACLALCSVLALLFQLVSVSADRFTVGDSKGWNPNVNYTEWVKKHEPFHVGDWLVFYYPAKQADVVLVDETAYEKCDASNPILNYSKGRSFAFELNETKRYYFICSYGYCYSGMKLSVKAEKLTAPSPPKSSANVKAAAPSLRPAAMFSVVFSLVARLLF